MVHLVLVFLLEFSIACCLASAYRQLTRRIWGRETRWQTAVMEKVSFISIGVTGIGNAHMKKADLPCHLSLGISHSNSVKVAFTWEDILS